jgi:hypothetical protein
VLCLLIAASAVFAAGRTREVRPSRIAPAKTREPRHPPRKPPSTNFNIRTDVGVLDTDSEGLTLSDLTSALHEALALARQSLLEGDRAGKDRRRWQVEIMDRGNQHLLSVKFAEVYACEFPVPSDENRSGGKRSH